MNPPLVIDAANLEDTRQLGRRLAALLPPGLVIALVGPMGAGKTHFVRAIVEGLGGSPRQVSSPTFALIHEYDTPRLPVAHFDTYRLPDEAAFADLGVEEYFTGQGVSLVEWADRVVATLPEDHLRIEILPTSPDARRFVVQALGPRSDEVARSLAKELPS